MVRLFKCLPFVLILIQDDQSVGAFVTAIFLAAHAFQNLADGVTWGRFGPEKVLEGEIFKEDVDGQLVHHVLRDDQNVVVLVLLRDLHHLLLRLLLRVPIGTCLHLVLVCRRIVSCEHV